MQRVLRPIADRVDDDATDPKSVLSKIMRVLAAFDEGHPRRTLSELSRVSQIPKTTVHRIVHELVDWGVLVRTGNFYWIGLRLLEVGSLSFGYQVRDVAMPFLRDLQAVTGETVHLAVLDGTDVVYLDKVYGRSPVRMPSRTGGRVPAACTAVGKALLAFSPPERQEQVLRRGLVAMTPYTVTDPVAFRAELADIARRGVALDRQEVQLGLVCAGVPIQVRPGSAAAAISVSGPANRLDLDRITTGLQATGMAISRALQQEVRRFCWRDACFPFESTEQVVAASTATSEYRVKVS
jgi:IclR family acetate operon transcriptional repressor